MGLRAGYSWLGSRPYLKSVSKIRCRVGFVFFCDNASLFIENHSVFIIRKHFHLISNLRHFRQSMCSSYLLVTCVKQRFKVADAR